MAQIEQVGDALYKVSGMVDFSTVTALLTQIHTLSGKEEKMTIDFSQLEHSNSAALALLLELKGEAMKQQRQVIFEKIPSSLLDLAQMSNIKEILLAAN